MVSGVIRHIQRNLVVLQVDSGLFIKYEVCSHCLHKGIRLVLQEQLLLVK